MLVGQANEIRIHFYCLLRSTKKAPIWLKRDKVCVIGNLANAVPLFYTTLYCPTLILLHLDFTPPLTLPHLQLYPTIYYTPPSTIPHHISPHPIIPHPI